MREKTEESEKVNTKTYKYCFDDFSSSGKQDSKVGPPSDKSNTSFSHASPVVSKFMQNKLNVYEKTIWI
jgi:hypothetical protein